MFGRIRAFCRRRFAALISDEIKLARHDVEVWRRECNDRVAEVNVGLKRIEELAYSNEFMGGVNRQLHQQIDSLGSQNDALTEERDSLTDQLKAADAAAQSLREELAAERAELASVQHDLDRTLKQLELAQAENRLLAEIHETDIQRRVKERNIEQSQGEMALADARRLATEQHLEAA